jgi:peptidoglycan/xylan/chitin deacetylase (PgdA/CDA1 family)
MKSFKSFFLLILLFSFTMFKAEPLVTLTAKQALGGALAKTNANDSVVYFPLANPVNDRIVWTIPGNLPSGLYQVDIDFYQPDSPYSPNQMLSFESEQGEKLAKFDLYYIGFTKGKFSRSIGFYSTKPVSVLSLIKSGQRNLNTVGISAIKISTANAASLEKLQFVFQLPVNQQQVISPIPLPTGVYVVNASKKVELKWNFTDGNSFKTPLSNEHRVFIDQPAQIYLNSDVLLTDLQLTRFPSSAGPDMTSAGNLPLMVASDTSKIEEHTLKLIGYKGNEMPKLDLLPGGKSIAVVTSWDDGQEKDLQVMETLLKYNMKGTFFMNRNSQMIPRLRELEEKGMEIGSHSWSHPAFYNSTPKRCLDEAVEMRRFLEKELGHPVVSFAYPFNYQPAYDLTGNYVLRSLHQAGYWSARATTTGDNRIDSMSEPLAMRPNFHFKIGASKTKEKMDELLKKPGSILYIWGHSYELAGEGQNTLDAVLAVVANHPEAWYATLGELMTWQFIRNNFQLMPKTKKTGGKEFTLKMPWLHPYLRQVPICLSVPEGVKEVLWQGKKMPVKKGHVQLLW